jgi:hypothetical protein
MIKNRVVVLFAAASLLAWGPAKADIIQLNFSGFLTGTDSLGTLGIVGQAIDDLPSSTAKVSIAGTATFDTSLGNLQTVATAGGGSYQTLSWTTGQGADPLQSVSVTLNGRERSPVFPFDFGPSQFFTDTYANFTSFSVSLSPLGSSTLFQFSSPNGGLTLSDSVDQANIHLNFTFNQGYQPPANYITSSGSMDSPEFPAAHHLLIEDQRMSDLGPSPVPEPTGWLLLTAGFGMLGAALRRSKGRIVIPGPA